MLSLVQQPARLNKNLLLMYHLVTIAVVVLGGYYAQLHTFTPRSDDFLSIIWQPGQNILRHEPVPLSYPYPLWTPLLMLPFSLWPAAQGIQLWAISNLLVLTLCLCLIMYLLGWEHYIALTPILSILAIVYYPAYIGVWAGQIVFLMLLLLLLFLWAYKNEYYFLAGAMLGLTLIKPHLVLLVTLMILAAALWKRNWKLLFAFGTVSAVLIGIALPFASAPQQIFGGGVSDHLLIYISQSSTVWGLSLRLLSRSVIPPAIASGLLLLGTLYWWVSAIKANQLQDRLYGLVAITTIVNLLVIPYSWSYNHVLFLFAICYGLHLAWRLLGTLRIPVMLLLLTLALVMPPVLFHMLAAPSGLDIHFVLLPLSLLPILVALQWYAQKELPRQPAG
jgi:hypothetical protein